MTVRLVAFSGSLRTDSLNHRLAAAASAFAREAGADVELVRLREFEMPLYDGDLEDAEGLPAGAQRFKALLRAADGWLIASPEYNGGVSGALKNAIDWASRTETSDEPPLAAFRGKVAGLLGASPGRLGAVRGLAQCHTILSGLGVHVLPNARGIAAAHEAFDDAGALVRDADRKAVESLARQLVDVCARLARD